MGINLKKDSIDQQDYYLAKKHSFETYTNTYGGFAKQIVWSLELAFFVLFKFREYCEHRRQSL